jgi:hypothetical protein
MQKAEATVQKTPSAGVTIGGGASRQPIDDEFLA